MTVVAMLEVRSESWKPLQQLDRDVLQSQRSAMMGASVGRAMGGALREHFSASGPSPLYVVVGRGCPNLVRRTSALAETCDALGLPYRFFGFDSAISEVVNYAQKVNAWMKAGGREAIAVRMGLGSFRLNHAEYRGRARRHRSFCRS
jgi:hypothetical protein